MAFLMKRGNISMDNTPIYQRDMEEGVMGMAQKNGSVIINKNLKPEVQKDVLRHEKVHLLQMKTGRLDYDEKNVYWDKNLDGKVKKYPRSAMEEGSKKLPWEVEAWAANKLKY